jgi:hypothetical protein
VKSFADWLSTTAPSVYIQMHEAWMIPTIQSVHIVCIGLVVGSVLMTALKVLGLAGADQTLRQTQRRYGPWTAGALWLLLATGLLMVIGEPVRELVTISFWVKMALVAAIAAIAIAFRRAVAGEAADEAAIAGRGSLKVGAVLTLVALALIIMLGRFIAYDHIWGPLSPATKA